MSDLTSKMARRVQPAARPAAEAFHPPSREMTRVTVYLPKDLVRGLKLAALDGGTSMSKILTAEAAKWLEAQPRNNAST